MQVPMILFHAMRLISSGSSMRTQDDTMFPFLTISSGAQLGRSGTLCIWGCLYFGSVVGPWLYPDDCNDIYAIVWSGDCKPTMYLFSYSVHVMCKDYPSCDIAYNAVMPLSRAPTRGRYSRIEGVTSRYQSLPWLRSPLLDRIAGIVESRKMFCVI